MAYQFPKDPYDGQSAEIKQPNGTEFVYTYNKAQNTWELAGQGVDLDQNNIVIYTDNVLARGSRPAANERNTNYKNNRNDSTFSALNNQQDINWVLHDAINLVEGATKVWIDDSEPMDESYQFWWHTRTLELLFKYNDQWWPVSIPPDQVENLTQALTDLQRDTMLNKLANDQLRRDIIAGDFRPNLEQVLKVGNVADKGVILTNAENDALLLSPEEGRVMVGGFGDGVVPRYELRHTDSFQDTSIVKLELDEDGARFDIECDEKVSNIHFRFEDEAKLDINKKGDAVFAGKVQGEPGTQNNEFVTYGQLTTLEEEIEQLAPSLERGSWTFTLNHPPGPGEYTMISGFLSEEDQLSLCTQAYTQCYADNIDDPIAQQQCSRDLEDCQNAVSGDEVLTTDNWTECEQLVFNNVDSKGVTHEWSGIDSDHYIDVFNEADEGFMVGNIATHDGGTFVLDIVSSKGTANGLATVKIFKTEGEVDFGQYVRKAGDTMTGLLTVEGNGVSKFYGPKGALAAYAGPEAVAGQHIFYVYGSPYEKEDGSGTTRDLIFSVVNDGRVYGKSGYKPTSADQFSTKRYVDEAISREVIAPARYEYKCYINQTGANSPGSGQAFFYGNDMTSSTIRLSLFAANAPVKIQGHASGITIFTYNSSLNNTYRAMTISCWYYRNSNGSEDWKWKGTAEIDSIKLYSDHILVNTSSNATRKWANGDIGAGGNYRFTISGLL